MARANAPIVTNPFTKNQDHRLQRDSTRGGWVSIEVSKARKALPTNAAGPPSRPNSPLQRLAETSHAHNHYAETIDSSEADFPGPDTNDRASSYKLQPTSYEKDVYYAIGPANHPLPPIDDSTYEPSLSSPLLSSDSLRRNSPVSAIIASDSPLAGRLSSSALVTTPTTAFLSFPYSPPRIKKKLAASKAKKRKPTGQPPSFELPGHVGPPVSRGKNHPGELHAVSAKARSQSAVKGGCSTITWQRAREIYEAGPSGEGQKLWRGVRRLYKGSGAEKRAAKQRGQFNKPLELSPIQIVNYDGAQPGHPIKMSPRTDRDTSESDHPYRLHPHSDKAAKIGSKLFEISGRGKEKASQSSESLQSPQTIVAPLLASASVQYEADYDAQERYMTTSKPLPPVPQLEPALRSRMLQQRQPPRIHPPAQLTSRSPVGAFSLPEGNQRLFVTLEDIQSLKPNRKVPKQRSREHFGWLTRAGTKLTHLKEKLKGKISAPQPMMAIDARTVNIAAESGGVGGPAAAVSLPVKNGVQINPKPTKEKKTQDTRSKPGLIRKYGDKQIQVVKDDSTPRRNGDAGTTGTSLMEHGAGIEEEEYLAASPYCPAHSQYQGRDRPREGPSGRRPRAAYNEYVGPPTRQPDYDEDSETRASLIPVPLFSGTPGDMPFSGEPRNRHPEARDVLEVRDTGFYQPYDDLLHEYRG